MSDGEHFRRALLDALLLVVCCLVLGAAWLIFPALQYVWMLCAFAVLGLTGYFLRKR